MSRLSYVLRPAASKAAAVNFAARLALHPLLALSQNITSFYVLRHACCSIK